MTLRLARRSQLLSFDRRRFLVGGASLVALAATGCAALESGIHDTTADFLVKPNADGSYFGWTEITVDQNVQESSGGQITAVTLDVEKPVGFPDMSFLESLTGEAVTSSARTLVVQVSSFPKGQEAIVADIQYHGDLKPLFKDPHTIRIEWKGVANTAYPGFPPDGIWIRVRLKVNIN